MQLYDISINNLRRRKVKMMFVLLGLIIGVATIVSVYAVVEAMKTKMTEQVAEFGANVVITPDAGGLAFSYGGITLPEIMYDVEQLNTDNLTTINNLPSRNEISAVAPKLLGISTLGSGEKVLLVGADLREEFKIKPWLKINGIKTSDELDLEPNKNEAIDEKKMSYEEIDLSRQDISQMKIDDNQIIVGSVLAASLNLSEGDNLSISGRELEVIGILTESGSQEDKQIYINLPVAQELLDRPNEITIIEMAVDYSQVSEEQLLAELEEAMPNPRITSLRQESLRRDEMMTRLVRFGMTISIIVLLVGMLVVGLTMSSAVRERTREIGVFRALGFRRSHIAKVILLEGTIISIIGGFVGYIIGMLIAGSSGSFIAGMDIVVAWEIENMLIAMMLAMFIGVASSLYPAYLAANQDPVEALRFF